MPTRVLNLAGTPLGDPAQITTAISDAHLATRQEVETDLGTARTAINNNTDARASDVTAAVGEAENRVSGQISGEAEAVRTHITNQHNSTRSALSGALNAKASSQHVTSTVATARDAIIQAVDGRSDLTVGYPLVGALSNGRLDPLDGDPSQPISRVTAIFLQVPRASRVWTVTWHIPDGFSGTGSHDYKIVPAPDFYDLALTQAPVWEQRGIPNTGVGNVEVSVGVMLAPGEYFFVQRVQGAVLSRCSRNFDTDIVPRGYTLKSDDLASFDGTAFPPARHGRGGLGDGYFAFVFG